MPFKLSINNSAFYAVIGNYVEKKISGAKNQKGKLIGKKYLSTTKLGGKRAIKTITVLLTFFYPVL